MRHNPETGALPEDRVTITSPALGSLVNHVHQSDQITPWTFGVRALYRNLARRGLLHQGNPSGGE